MIGEDTEDDFYDESILKSLDGGWDITIAGQSVKRVAKLRPHAGDAKTRVWESHLNLEDGAWVKCSTVIYRQDPAVDIYFWLGYGRSDVETPIIERRMVDAKIPDTTLLRLDDEATVVLHGQATPPRRISYDFRTKRVGDQLIGLENYEVTQYAPSYANQTGGNYLYFSARYYPIKKSPRDYWRRQLYAIGNYPGNLVNSDGSFVHERGWPNAVLATGNHFHENTPAYIKYTDPRNPWRDRACYDTRPEGKRSRWSCDDGQHANIRIPVCQAWDEWPDDEGFRWLVLSGAHRYLMQWPGRDKGTFRWDPGQARGEGRMFQTLVQLSRTLRNHGEDDLALDIERRCGEKWTHLRNHMLKRLQSGEEWRIVFSGHWGWSPGEHGIMFHGLSAIDDRINDFGVNLAEVDYLKDLVAKAVFDAFSYFDIPGDRGWSLPYYVRWDGGIPGPSSMAHFGWLAAMHYEPQNEMERDKHKAIEDLGDQINERWRVM